MPSVQYLREFINERLTAAAEQIFLEFEKTIVQYEEEIDRQRRLLDITWKPQIKLHRTAPRRCLPNCSGGCSRGFLPAGMGCFPKETPQEMGETVRHIVPPDVPQQPVCEEEEVLPEQQLCDQERSSSVEQEEPEPPQIKEEQEELCSSQEGEQLGLKEEPDTFMVTAAEEGDHSEPGGDGEQLLAHSSAGAENQDQEGSKNSRSSRKRNKSHKIEEGPTAPGSRCHSAKCKKSLKCDVCGKAFEFNYQMKIHYRIHTGERPFACKMCGKMFRCNNSLSKHIRTHTGGKPFSCTICGKMFKRSSHLTEHIMTHTGEKCCSCPTCGKMFAYNRDLLKHSRSHTGEKPYHCKTCGKVFGYSSSLFKHMRVHAGLKPSRKTWKNVQK
ncbi:uncharacterized protein LOC102079115 isoform X2 [Oreochromis niloticus]|uniref:uncharacterized protein LOC102079115 isoform X2 n=1 Tax=Oreochromis niloticus TaxID=8128 RepID=UPI00090557E6|nr:uncharacterized protein LOC102079115 isoform X2 [Oreochromis niloticus]